MNEREYIINKAKELGITSEELGFAKQIETITVKDEELYHDLRDYIEYNDNPEVARDYFDEKYWDDLKIRPEKKYKVIGVKVKKTIYKEIKVVMPDDKDINSVDEYAENLDYLDNDYLDDEEDWEIDDYDVLKDDMTAKEIDYSYNSDDIWNYDDFEDQ